MTELKYWKRDKEMEQNDEEIVYAWENKYTDAYVTVNAGARYGEDGVEGVPESKAEVYWSWNVREGQARRQDVGNNALDDIAEGENKQKVKEETVEWLKKNDTGRMGLEQLPAPEEVGDYDKEEHYDEMISYAGVEERDGSRYLVYMEIRWAGHIEEREIYSLSGSVRGPDGNFSEFRPTTKPVSDPLGGIQTLKDVMATYSPSDAVDDETR